MALNGHFKGRVTRYPARTILHMIRIHGEGGMRE